MILFLVAFGIVAYAGYGVLRELNAWRAMREKPIVVACPHAGVVARVIVRDGQEVAADEPLLTLRATTPSSDSERQRLNDRLQAARSELAAFDAAARWSPNGADGGHNADAFGHSDRVSQTTGEVAKRSLLTARIVRLERELRAAIDEVRERTITAPSAGQVLRVHRFTGERVFTEEPLIEIIPRNTSAH